MDNSKNYITILIDSLNKKIKLLDYILVENKRQQLSVSSEKMDEELFQETMAKKEDYINQINEIDQGFETVYHHVQKELSENAGQYKDEISELKELISVITQKSMEVQLSEKRNEQLITKKFSDIRKEIHKSKNVSKVATDYYKTMSKTSIVEPQYLDKKK
ncbi:MAG: flagellar protein FliT [Lachnospiraceae bacterium]|nr:flagellar protein FliT [Lachnospiraceae bacterium]